VHFVNSRLLTFCLLIRPKCDGFLVASDTVDPAIDSVNIVHEGPEDYQNMWQKVRSTWSYIYDNYYEAFDWFHIGGDDLFLIVENLRFYLESEEIQTAQNGGIYLPDDNAKEMQVPLFLGRRFKFKGRESEVFNSGGPGYTLNKAALKILVVEGLLKFYAEHVVSAEDVLVAQVLRQFGIFPYETKDEAGSERYMPFTPGFHYSGKTIWWLSKASINVTEGVNHSSPRSVAFHYVKDDMMKRVFALLYHPCPAEEQR
jgi:glycoprotein-N-acetylgalactosamine 3-beta-galactosyltransferase